MIVLLGETGAGKSALESLLSETLGVKRVALYTTRPIRKGEKNGYPHRFITASEHQKMLEEHLFLIHMEFNGYHYSYHKKDCILSSVCTTTHGGLKQFIKLKNNNIMDIISFYLQVDPSIRNQRALQRGDDPAILKKRQLHDQLDLAGIEQNVDYIIENNGEITTALDSISKILCENHSGIIPVKQKHKMRSVGKHAYGK